MFFRFIKIEIVAPVFFGAVLSLVICTVLAVSIDNYLKPAPEIALEIDIEEEDVEYEDFTHFFSRAEKDADLILNMYRNPEHSEWVIKFFTGICSSRDIAAAILDNSDTYEISPALAFALSWEESQFNPRAINRSNSDGSIDRGLFQLNNRSFPHLDLASFFDIGLNSRHGIAHLRHCLNLSGNEITALAMYNAGSGRVRGHGAPRVTLDYINRILNNREKIEKRFEERLNSLLITINE